MEPTVLSPLAAWESFYVIVGSSGAALTGLQFVVIALVAEARVQSSSREIEAFGTPTVVHFCVVLLGASSLLLLAIGIHNSWDTVTYIAVGRGQAARRPPE